MIGTGIFCMNRLSMVILDLFIDVPHSDAWDDLAPVRKLGADHDMYAACFIIMCLLSD